MEVRIVVVSAVLGVVLVGAPAARADDTAAPPSLRMRPHEASPRARQVAQAPGDPEDDFAGDPDDADEFDEDATTSASPAEPARADDTVAPPGLAPVIIVPIAPVRGSSRAVQVIPRPAASVPAIDAGERRAVSIGSTGVSSGAGGVSSGASSGSFGVSTGSLIERATRITPSPMTVLTREDLLAAGRTMVGDILQPLPEQGNAANAQFNNGGDGATRIDLRSLGAARTLVLVDGRRHVNIGNGANTSVDLNMIPLAAIERVEILKDAGSAIYGSDAVGGVVNVITRSRLNGTEASVYTAQTERDDGFTVDASFITGHRTDSGRGNIVFSAGTQRQEPVFAGDRAFSEFDKTFNFANQTEALGGSTATPSGRINARQIDVNGDGRPDVVNVCGVNVTFCTNDGAGGFRPFISPDDNYNFQPPNYLYTPSSRFNAYSAGSFKLLPEVAGFFQASFMHRESEQQLAPEPFQNAAVISRNSIFNPFGGDVLGYSRRLEELGPRSSRQNVDTFRLVTGVQGSVPEGLGLLSNWRWELSFNLGRSATTLNNEGNLIRSRLRAAVGPSFIDASGVPRCGTPAAPIAGCVPMNILGPSGSISPDAVQFAGFTGVSSGLNEQQMALATVSGRIARLPNNGDLSVAFGTDVRRERGEVTPDALIASGESTGAQIVPFQGELSVLESFAEARLVAARDRNGLERLELDASARASRYDTSLSAVGWNARALIRPVSGVALRATTAQGFHAPTLVDLFRNATDSFPVGRDPCDTLGQVISPAARAQCARQGVPPNAVFGTLQQRQVLRGHPDLDAETAKVETAGVVLEPGRGLTLSVDFWRIRVEQSIQTPALAAVFTNCYERGIQAFCDRVHRNPNLNFAIDFVDGAGINAGSTSTAGIDAALDLEQRTPGGGLLRARAEVQRLRQFDVDNTVTVVNGVGVYDLGVLPETKANVSAFFQQGGVGAGFNFTFVDTFLECDGNNCNGGAPSRDVGDYQKLDVFGSLRFGRGPGTTLTMGVNNVLDRTPPTIYVGFFGDSDGATYDFLGRMFYARLTQQF